MVQGRTVHLTTVASLVNSVSPIIGLLGRFLGRALHILAVALPMELIRDSTPYIGSVCMPVHRLVLDCLSTAWMLQRLRLAKNKVSMFGKYILRLSVFMCLSKNVQ